jgi:hypothetical protein
MVQTLDANKLQYVPLPRDINKQLLVKAYERGAFRRVIQLRRCELTYEGETYFEFEVEGHELESYHVKIKKSKWGARGSCHCHDFRYRRLPRFLHEKKKEWCKHLLSCLIVIEELERENLIHPLPYQK